MKAMLESLTHARESGVSNEEWPSLNHQRLTFSCVLCNGKVYVIGGKGVGHDEYLNSIECLDLSASPRQWITMDQGLQTARHKCRCVARGTQVYIIGGYGNRNQLTSVEILKTETGQLVAGPDMPQHKTFAAAAVNNELLVFAQQKPVEGDGYVGKIHTLRRRLNSTWEMTSFSLQSKTLVSQPIVIGVCVLLSRYSVYNTRRACWWDLPTNSSLSMFYGALVGEAEIIAFDKSGIYSLKLKRSVEPLKSTIPRHTKDVLESLLCSPDFRDVIFVCADGIEVPAHRNILAAKNPYSRTYFGSPWTEQHPDGRWETENSSDVVKALLSLMYTGGVTDSTLLQLSGTVYEFQLEDDLVRVCQAKCIDNINESNVKDFFLSAKMHGASFLFDACFKYVCEHFSKFGSDPDFAEDIIKADRQLWRDIFQSWSSSKKRKRSDDV